MYIRRLLLLATFLLVPGFAGAQELEDYDYENLSFNGIGVELGGIWPSNVESTLFVGVRGDLGYLGPNLRIVPSILFWSSDLESGEVDRFAEQIIRVCRLQPNAACPSRLDLGDIGLSDLILNADAHYEFETPLILTPYLGAGLGIHLLNGSGEFVDNTFIEDLLDAITPAVNLIAGAALPLGGGLNLFAEGRYVLVSDVPQAGLSIGGSWSFYPQPAIR